jgi:hypothetical protein
MTEQSSFIIINDETLGASLTGWAGFESGLSVKVGSLTFHFFSGPPNLSVLRDWLFVR